MATLRSISARIFISSLIDGPPLACGVDSIWSISARRCHSRFNSASACTTALRKTSIALTRFRRQAPLVLSALLLARFLAVLGTALARAEHHVAIVVETAVKLLRRSVVDQYEAVGDQPKQMAVMADHDHRSGKIGQGLDQRLARVHVEMVGRLVQDQDMRRVSCDQRERQPRPLAARELAHLDIRLVAREAEAAELSADRAGLCTRQQPLHVLKRRLVRNEFLDLMLREIADPQFAAGDQRTAHRLQLTCQEARQSRLAIAVAAHQRDAVVGIDPQIQP